MPCAFDVRQPVAPATLAGMNRLVLPLAFAVWSCGLAFAAPEPSVPAASTVSAEPSPRIRPESWAKPLIQTSLANVYRVSADLYRCEQPGSDDIADLKALGMRTIFNLRNYHSDSKKFTAAGFTLLANPIDAGDVTEDYLVATLRQFRAAPKPVIVHCWHGSDRTGVFVAAYRIAFEGWTREAALDEFRHGGYGFHEKWYPNLVKLLESIDAEQLRRRVQE